MEIVLPNRISPTTPVSVDARTIVVIGANGSGKTRFGADIESRHNKITHRISAQKSLSMPEEVRPTTIQNAENDFFYGYATGDLGYKIRQRWGNKPSTWLLNDYDKLMVLLHTEEYEESVKFLDAYNPGQADYKPITKLDRVQSIWEEILPHRKLIKKAGQIETYPTGSPDRKYNAAEMSDGERVIFYLIGEVVSVPQSSIIIVDEPEMHLHKSITKNLWDKIEKERPDCTFVYLTHDIDFAFSRSDSKKIWVKAFNGTQWDYEILEEDSQVPEQLYLDILGSRKPILFIEGDDSSIDYLLFQLVFPELTVKPLGGCSKVLATTKSFREQSSFHNLDSFGLIDRDRRSDEQVEHITARGIWVSEVAEVENFLILEEVVRVVASCMNKDPEEVSVAVKKNVIEFFNQEIETQITLHTVARTKAFFNNALDYDGMKQLGDIEQGLADLLTKLEVKKIHNEIKSDFEELIRMSDYDGIIKVFNNKGILSRSDVARLCDLNPFGNVYLNYVLSILKQDSELSNRIRKAIIGKIRK